MDMWLSKMQPTSANAATSPEKTERRSSTLIESEKNIPSVDAVDLGPEGQNWIPSKRSLNQLERISGRSRAKADKPEVITTLEDAWKAHRCLYDLDGNGCIGVEELIIVLDSVRLFDGMFTQRKVRDYFKSLYDGEGLQHIGYRDFQDALQWVAYMKGMDLETLVKKVIILSKRLVAGKAKVNQRLEVIFDFYCTRNPDHMSAFEFGELCRRLKLPLCLGDVFLLFSRVPGGVNGKGVDYQGFIKVITEVGDLLKLSTEDAKEAFGKATTFLDHNLKMYNLRLITRVKFRMRRAAATVMGANWVKFFENIDLDGTGSLDWEEFLLMARNRLHLDDKKSHLRIIFEAIDVDGSDEVSLKELIDFMASE